MENQELKVVIHLKGNQASVGVQKKDTDPVVEMHVGDLQAILDVIPEVVERAKQRWGSNPRNPNYQRPPEQPQPQSQTQMKQSGKQATSQNQMQPLF